MDEAKKTTATKKSNPNLLAMCLGACCVLMGLALIGAYAGKDTSLKGVAQTPPQPTTITNNNYHVNGQPTTQQPDLPQMPQVRPTTPVSTVAYQPQPQTVYVQASPEPVVQQKIVYVEQPRPDPVPDTTIVIYKPEIRQPVQRIVVVDERFERLKAEHEQRMREWTSGPVVVVGR